MGLHPHFPVEHMDQVIFVQVGILGQVVQRNRLGKMLIDVQPHTGTFPGAFAGAGGGMAVLTQAGNAQHKSRVMAERTPSRALNPWWLI